MYKIYRKTNYIIIEDVSRKETYYGLAKDVFVDKSNISKSEYKIYKVNNLPKSTLFTIGNILKEGGTPYTQSEWETFYEENTGFSTASGGSGAYNFPLVDGTAGQVMTTDGSGQVTFEDNLTSVEKYGNIEIPADFNNPFGALKITRPLGGNAQLLNINKDTYRKKLNTSTDRYVDSVNGSDANDGLTWATAYQTFQEAYDDSPDRIYLAGNQNYWRLAPAIVVSDVEVISIGGKSNYCYGITGDERTWTDETGGVWSNSIGASFQGVFDSAAWDENGYLYAYEEQTNLTDVQNTSGSFWKDSGSGKLYIHTLDDLTPDRNSIVCQISEVTLGGSVDWFYLENVTVLGGFRYLSGNDSTDSFYNCDFIYSDVNGYMAGTGAKTIYIENCTAYRNVDDGFDYDDEAKAIEVNCLGFENGYGASTGINNGSTAHGDSIVIRINGIYHSNEGPNVHDVNNAKSLNIDCIAYNSTSTIAGNKSAFACGISTDLAQMWLDGCATKNDDTFGAEIRSVNADIYVRNSIIKNIENGTTLTDY